MARRTGLRALLLLCLLALATALWGKKDAAKDAAPAAAEGGKKKAKDVTKLQIGVKRKVADCARRAVDGDRVYVHYRGTLTDGEQFDASYDRGTPFDFVLGQGSVIKGWDLGVSGMCPGEMRKLQIPSDLGYGANGSPPKIPGGATLIFQVELLSIGEPPKAEL